MEGANTETGLPLPRFRVAAAGEDMLDGTIRVYDELIRYLGKFFLVAADLDVPSYKVGYTGPAALRPSRHGLRIVQNTTACIYFKRRMFIDS